MPTKKPAIKTASKVAAKRTAAAVKDASARVVPKLAAAKTIKAAPVAEKPKQFKSWSFSRFSQWAKCALQAKLIHLDKMGVAQNEAMARGADIGARTEQYLIGKSPKMPEELKSLASDYAELRKKKGLMVEDSWTMTANWTPTFATDWDNAWVRTKIDVAWISKRGKINVLSVRDSKTGKFRENQVDEYMLQLDLYAASGIAQFPQVDEIDVQLLYTDLGIRYPEAPVVYTAAEALAAQKEWNKRVKPMLADRTFKPTASIQCNWCPFSRKKGGPCKY